MASLLDESRLRETISRGATALRGMIRRFTVAATSDGLWNLLGYEGEDDASVEPFSGIGFYSRPPASGTDPEVITAKVGGKNRNSVIIATRDEKLRRQISEANLAEDETIIFNSKSVIHIKADGTIEIKSAGGVASPLVTQAEYNAHVHPTGVGPSGVPSPLSVGTTKLKAE